MTKKEYNEKYRADPINHVRILANAARYRKLPEVILRRKKWREENREYTREYNRKHRRKRRLKVYGLSEKEYENMWKRQKNSCPICSNGLDMEAVNTYHIDHDHKTNVVRGILCRSCNLLLGFSKDDVSILLSAIKYIKKYV